MVTKPKQIVHGGRFYGQVTRGGPLVPVEADPGDATLWICRRVADYQGPVPAGGSVTECRRCRAPIVFNPARRGVTAPKVCMQCADIQPLPIPPQS